MEISFETPRGALIEIKAGKIGGFDASINGKRHTSNVADFIANDPVAGPCVKLAGNGKAQIPAESVEAVAEFFAAAKVAQAAALKAAGEAYVESAEGKAEIFSARMHQRMYGRNSKH